MVSKKTSINAAELSGVINAEEQAHRRSYTSPNEIEIDLEQDPRPRVGSTDGVSE